MHTLEQCRQCPDPKILYLSAVISQISSCTQHKCGAARKCPQQHLNITVSHLQPFLCRRLLCICAMYSWGCCDPRLMREHQHIRKGLSVIKCPPLLPFHPSLKRQSSSPAGVCIFLYFVVFCRFHYTMGLVWPRTVTSVSAPHLHMHTQTHTLAHTQRWRLGWICSLTTENRVSD